MATSSPSCLFENCGGTGICNETSPSPFCYCTEPYVNLGDFLPEPNLICSINFLASRVFWGFCAAISGFCVISFLFGLKVLQRGSPDRTRREVIALCNLIAADTFLLVVGALEASAESPGQRAIGTDLATTLFFVFHEIFANFHALFLPYFQTGTSVLPYALESYPLSKSGKKLLFRVYAFILLVCLFGSSAMIVAIVFYPQFSFALIRAFNLMLFIMTFTSGFFCTLLLTRLLSALAIMASPSRDMSSVAREAVRATSKRARNTRKISLFVTILYAPVFLMFVCDPTLLYRGGWIWIPWSRFSAQFFHVRHVYLSISTSLAYSSHDPQEDDDKGCSNSKFRTTQPTEQKKDDAAGESDDTFSPTILPALKNKTKKPRKKKVLTRVEEELTADLRTTVVEEPLGSTAIRPVKL